MAKKDKKGEGAVQNREIFQRMNFLYQASMYLASITTARPQPPRPAKARSKDNVAIKDSGKAAEEPIAVDAAREQVADVDMEGNNATRDTDAPVFTTPIIAATAAEQSNSETRLPQKLNRRKRRELIRLRKVRIAMEQISTDSAHQGLINTKSSSSANVDVHQLSGTARFYASTLREVGRKNVIRIGPTMKRSICQRCEALLIPAISCEVRIQATPQLHTLVTCTACGAFRRYFCMPGRGIEDDGFEPKASSTAAGTKSLEVEAEPTIVVGDLHPRQDGVDRPEV